MAEFLEDQDWRLFLRRIQAGKCTPLIGADIGTGVGSSLAEMARHWVQEYDYPLGGSPDLARIAQYIAVRDPIAAKEQIQEWMTRIGAVSLASSPYDILADLPLPIYITTSYDDQLEQALRRRGREPRRELCRWNRELVAQLRSGLEDGVAPSEHEPLVFYLYGHYSVPESLVVSEDDYLDFLVNVSSGQYQLPLLIQRTLAGTSLLFLGYRLGEWDFRILFRGIVASSEASLRRLSITVQLPPLPDDAPGETKLRAQRFLGDYFQRREVRVYWGSAEAFTAELRQRWQELGLAAVNPVAPAVGHSYRAIVREQIDSVFGIEDLRTICFDLSIDFDNLRGEAKVDKIRELIIFVERSGRLRELIEICRRMRPNAVW